MIVIAPTFTDPTNTPIFGWRNVVTSGSIDATTELSEYPASNLANPSTALFWKGGVSSPGVDTYLTATTNSVDPIDYVAIARHNFGSAHIPVSIEGAVGLAGSPPSFAWQELIQDTMLPDDGPVLFRFPPQSLHAVRVRLQPGEAAPFAAVMYAGKLLICERGMPNDHVPVVFGRRVNVMSSRSESGQFLGRIVLGEHRATAFSLQHVPVPWYRSEMDPFLIDAKERPFFFAWKPSEYPNDVGFCWITGDPEVSSIFETGRMSVSFEMNGVA